MMLVVLTGYMGSGKSVTGKLLSEALESRFIDLDDYIAEQENMRIPELFRVKGEIWFRKKERFYLEAVLKSKVKTVIALGGGTPCYGENMERILSRTPHVFYLKASVATLIRRLEKEQHNRPLIKDIKKADLPDFIRKHLFERHYFYAKAPDTIAVDGLSPAEVAARIMERITPDGV